MIHLTKNKKGQVQVAITAKNGELLSITEGFESRQAALKNIHAQRVNFCAYGAAPLSTIQDETKAKPTILRMTYDGKVAQMPKQDVPGFLVPVYVPGKNKKSVVLRKNR